jgi:tRNA-2-methylthio-N6-dimethylallyladenosine synthase
MKYHIVTFGCAANTADSERIATYYAARGFTATDDIKTADTVIINTCMIRQMAEDRLYGLVHNLAKEKLKGRKVKIVVTGCMVGMTVRDKTGKLLDNLRKRIPEVDEFLPIEEVGFDLTPIRSDPDHGLVPISNGCNNFCTYCVVPFSRGREVSRPFEDILSECRDLAQKGYSYVTLVGQNVNSYGADLLQKSKIQNPKSITQLNKQENLNPKVTYVKHLGRLRIPTMFPYLLAKVCDIEGIEKVDFISSNPWDFSDDLIRVISDNPKISRQIHLPVQSGDARMLKKMNRWYTPSQYLKLVAKLKNAIPGLSISTDIIVGYCGETEKQFQNTVNLSKKVGFFKAYVAMYSDRPMTAAHKVYKDTVPYLEKKRRWKILEDLINTPNLKHWK